MGKQPDQVWAEAYVVLEPKWNTYWKDDDGHPVLAGARITKTTAKRPTVGKDGGVVLKLKFRVNSKVLLPLRPEAVIDIDHANAEVIEVEALDPREEEG